MSFHHLPPELSINLESMVHNAVKTFDEAVEVLHLLCHVLVVLQRLMVLPKCGKRDKLKKSEGLCVGCTVVCRFSKLNDTEKHVKVLVTEQMSYISVMTLFHYYLS